MGHLQDDKEACPFTLRVRRDGNFSLSLNEEETTPDDANLLRISGSLDNHLPSTLNSFFLQVTSNLNCLVMKLLVLTMSNMASDRFQINKYNFPVVYSLTKRAVQYRFATRKQKSLENTYLEFLGMPEPSSECIDLYLKVFPASIYQSRPLSILPPADEEIPEATMIKKVHYKNDHSEKITLPHPGSLLLLPLTPQSPGPSQPPIFVRPGPPETPAVSAAATAAASLQPEKSKRPETDDVLNACVPPSTLIASLDKDELTKLYNANFPPLPI